MNRPKKRPKLIITAIILIICLSSVNIHSGFWSSILNTGCSSKNNVSPCMSISIDNIVETQGTDIQSLHMTTSNTESTDENNSSNSTKNYSHDTLTHNDSEELMHLSFEETVSTLNKNQDESCTELDFSQILDLSRDLHNTDYTPSAELCHFIPNLNGDNYLDLAYLRAFHVPNIPQILLNQNLHLSFTQLNQYFPLILSNLQTLYPQLNEASFNLEDNGLSVLKWFMRIFPKPYTEEYVLVIKVDLVDTGNDSVGNQYLIYNHKVETRNPYLYKLLKPLYLVVATELEKERQDQEKHRYGIAFSNNNEQVLTRDIQAKYRSLKSLIKITQPMCTNKLLELVVSTYMFKEALLENNHYLGDQSDETNVINQNTGSKYSLRNSLEDIQVFFDSVKITKI